MGDRGFSLIEILTVLAVVSILSAIAIPRYRAARERAWVSTMMGDLHSLRLAQEIYQRAPEHDYASSLAELGDGFSTSEGVTITILYGGQEYAAEARHAATTRVCTFATDDGVVRCGEPVTTGDGGGE